MFTPLLGADNSELGNIILGYIADPISISDSLTLTQTITKSRVHSESLSDTLIFTETTSGQHVHNNSITDTITFTETTSEQTIHNRSLSDTIVFTETTSDLLSFARSLDDTLTLVQTLTPHVVHFRTIDDTLVFVEDVSLTASLTKTINQTLTFTETITVNKVLNKTISQTLIFSENFYESQIIIFDSILGDNPTVLGHIILGHVPYYPVIIIDDLGITDDLNPPHKIIDTLDLVETLVWENIYQSSFIDTLVFEEFIDIQQSIITVIDTLHFTQTISGIKGSYHPQNLTQILHLSETVRIELIGTHLVIDNLNLVEHLTTTEDTYNRTLTDNLSLIETITHHRENNDFVAQTLFLVEILTYEHIKSHKIVDHLVLHDTIHLNIVANRTIRDKITFLDHIPVNINYYTTIYVDNIQYTVTHHKDIVCCTV